MHINVPDLMSLFEGYSAAYGIYTITGEHRGEKILGKAKSVKGPVTIELWSDHVSGKNGIGIIPINEDSNVKFAAIDVDNYDLELEELAKKIEKLPLVLCRTKSGGAHLYLFLTDFFSAVDVQAKMREFAALLGFGGVEIFPKQTRIITERGDIGQWINMPYFNVSRTTRHAYDNTGKILELDEFIKFAFSKRITPAQLVTFSDNRELITGGPPCLNHLAKTLFPEGTRNNGLFNLGVYCRKAYPDSWQGKVEEMNTRFMDPPLPAVEVLGVIKSLNKKDFQYTCSQPPIKQHCDRDKCRLCPHGIGGFDYGFPKFGTLTKLLTEPPIWFLEVEGGGRLELSTADLQSPLSFQLRCMEHLSIMPNLPKREAWTEMIQRLMSDVTVVEVPREATPMGLLMQHLEEFCTSRASGKSADELLLGKPWTNNHMHYFRVRDFVEYLKRLKFNEYPLQKIAMRLKDMGAEPKFFNIKGKGVNTLAIKEFNNKQLQPLDIPEVGKESPF